MRPRLDEPTGLEVLIELVERATARYLDSERLLPEDFVTEEERMELREQYERPDGGFRLEAFHAEVERQALTRMTPAQAAIYTVQNAAYVALPENPFYDSHYEGPWREINHALLIVDTFAQVASDDTKAVFSRYTQTMRDLQDRASKAGLHLSVLTIDHATKAGDAYMGSLAKEGNVDTLMEVERAGAANSMKLTCHKQKDAADFEPTHLDMVPVTVEGFSDGYGRPLQTLRVADGAHSARLRRAVGAEGDTAAACLLGLLTGSAPLHLEELRNRFMALPNQKDKKETSVKRTFKRAMDSLLEDDLIELSEADLVKAIT